MSSTPRPVTTDAGASLAQQTPQPEGGATGTGVEEPTASPVKKKKKSNAYNHNMLLNHKGLPGLQITMAGAAFVPRGARIPTKHYVEIFISSFKHHFEFQALFGSPCFLFEFGKHCFSFILPCFNVPFPLLISRRFARRNLKQLMYIYKTWASTVYPKLSHADFFDKTADMSGKVRVSAVRVLVSFILAKQMSSPTDCRLVFLFVPTTECHC